MAHDQNQTNHNDQPDEREILLIVNENSKWNQESEMQRQSYNWFSSESDRVSDTSFLDQLQSEERQPGNLRCF